MAVPVTYTVDDGVAILTIENPPVNALAQPVRAALLAAVLSAESDPVVQGVVLLGTGRYFVAGADLREFDAPPRTPLLNDVLLRIEALNKPVIAALHGAALGGGLELALACHYRCATRDASLGLPEIKLALMPGSGGTQRLPRLVGAEIALEMMLGGEPVTAARALELGILDQLVEDTDLAGAAKKLLRDLIAQGKGPRRVRDLTPNPEPNNAALYARERERLSAPNFR